jgi:hypothetical protein
MLQGAYLSHDEKVELVRKVIKYYRSFVINPQSNSISNSIASSIEEEFKMSPSNENVDDNGPDNFSVEINENDPDYYYYK